VDADDPQSERHRGGDREHHERERRLREVAGEEILHRTH
jgi:hypothetical protein